MFEVASLLIVLMMSLIITRVATVALALTGMTQQSARFQARSALTGAGFTTSESERVVNHPVRRRIIMSLMLIGNTGLVLVASLLIVLLAGDEQIEARDRAMQIAYALGGLSLLYVAARSAWLERVLAGFIERILARHTDLPSRDYASLLHLAGGYRVVELEVEDGDWLAGRSLAQLGLSDEGILVLGVMRGGDYLGAPRGDAVLEVEDVVMLYGRETALDELDRRKAGVGGQLRHNEAVVKESIQQSDEQLADEEEEAQAESAR